MTGAALYEQKEKRTALRMNHYYKSDYVSYHVIKSLLGITLAFVLIAAMWILYHGEAILEDLTLASALAMVRSGLLWYVAMAVVYLVISIFYFRWKYDQAKKQMKPYVTALKRLQKFYLRSKEDGRS